MDFTIVSWNIDGLSDNVPSLNTLTEETEPDIINLQETNLRRANAAATSREIDEDYIMNCNCRDDDAPLSEKISEAAALLFKSHGTATLWKQNPKVQVIPLNTPTYQMSASRVNVRNKTILNIGCYFPTTTTDKDQDYENYLAMLGEFIENNTQEDQEMIITADFNIHLQGDKNQSTQRRITAYEDFKQEYNLVETRPTSDTFFSKANESQSCLDWILTTKGVTVDFVETRKQTEFAHSSDHLPVMIKVKIE